MLGPHRWAFLGGAAFALILIAEILRHGELAVLALPVVCYLAIGFYCSLLTVELRARRTLSERRVLSGEPVRVHVTLENESVQAHIELIEVTDNVPPLLTVTEHTPRKVETLPPEGHLSFSYAVQGMRGLAQWKTLSVTVTDTLGLFTQRLELSCESELLIVPTFERLDEILIRSRRTRIFSGQVKARLGGTGIEFFGVREYYPGDERRYVNWKATARKDRLIVNEFEQERVADVVILLDARERSDVVAPTLDLSSPSPPSPLPSEGEGSRGVRAFSLFEHSVRAALALAHYFTVQGNRVGLLIYGKYLEWTWPGFGRWQRERLLRAIASAEKGDKAVFEDLENLPTRLLPAGSQLVFVGPIIESDVKTIVDLRFRYEILCIAPNPIIFESAFLSPTPEVSVALRMEHLRRQAVLARMRRAGIRVVDWDVTKPLAAVVEGELGQVAARAALIRQRIR